jgi:hypothetical protein
VFAGDNQTVARGNWKPITYYETTIILQENAILGETAKWTAFFSHKPTIRPDGKRACAAAAKPPLQDLSADETITLKGERFESFGCVIDSAPLHQSSCCHNSSQFWPRNADIYFYYGALRWRLQRC